MAGRDRAMMSFRIAVPRRIALGWAAWVGVVTLVVVAAPAFGSDVGGTLAIVPALVLVGLVLAERRGRAHVARRSPGAGVAVVVALAAADLARPASSRTHLGRFADRLVSGDGGDVLARKLQGNLAHLDLELLELRVVTFFSRSPPWPPAVAPPARCRHRRPYLHVCVPRRRRTNGVLGMALNDSGIVVPGIMLAIVVPFLVVCTFPPAARERGG